MQQSKGSNSAAKQSSNGQTSLHFGTISAIDEATGEARVTLPDLGIESYWLKILVRRSSADKHADWLDVGDRVACLLDEKGEAGVVLGAIYTEENPPPISTNDKWYRKFSDNTTIEYDRATHKLSFQVQGAIDMIATGNVLIVGSRVDINP